MNDELEELARRAIACKGWRWMAGMRTLGGTVHTRPVVVLVADDNSMPVEWAAPPSDAHRHEVMSAYGNPGWRDDQWERALPDLTDPATLGCLLALVREAWDIPEMGTRGHNEVCDEWVVAHCGGPITMPITIEAAALVAALEGAP